MEIDNGTAALSTRMIRRFGLPLLAGVIMSFPGRAFSANVLFVVGGSGSQVTLNTSDTRVKSLLDAKGHNVTLMYAVNATSASASGKALVLVSATVNSADVAAKFKSVAVPVLNWEPFIFDDMAMTASGTNTPNVEYGTVTNITQVVVNLPSHQMAAGFNGGVAVYDAVRSGTFGKPGVNAIKVAVAASDASKIQIFGYEAGASMVGFSAPARRVGFFLDDLSGENLSGNGEVLFQAAVNWAMSVFQPAIVAQPAPTNVTVGQTASFTVTANGGALSYQWRKNGVNIPGATNVTYVTPATTSGDNGALFSVLITNTAGTQLSNNAVLTVGTSSPMVVTQPVDKAIEESQTVTFQVDAAGTPPLVYQWKRGAVVVGTNSPSYTIPPATLADNGSTYTCTITNGSGIATSNTVKLIVVATAHVAERRFYETLNGTVPSFSVGWNNAANKQYAYVEQAGVESIRMKGIFVTVPSVLNFGPEGNIGFKWSRDEGTNVDVLSLGTGNQDTPQFNVVEVVRTPEGVSGMNFPMGFTFPSQEKADELDPNLIWITGGEGKNTGMSFSRSTSGFDNTTVESGGLNANRVGFIQGYESTEIGHEFKDSSKSYLDGGQLRISRRTLSGTSDVEEVTTVDAFSVRTGTVVASSMVTTPKWRVASSLPDYVFEDRYKLRSLEETEAFAKKHKHLPNMPSAREMSEKGMDLAEMNLQLLKTVEELTLHMVAMKKEIKSQHSEIRKLQGRSGMSTGKAEGK